MDLTCKLTAHSKGTVNIQGSKTKKFEIKECLWQDDWLAAVLFNIILQKVSELQKDQNVIIMEKGMKIIVYPYDIIIIGRSKKGVCEHYKTLKERLHIVVLEINTHETKLLGMKIAHSLGQNWTIGEVSIEIVPDFICLGSKVIWTNFVHEMQQRITKETKAIYALHTVLK